MIAKHEQGFVKEQQQIAMNEVDNLERNFQDRLVQMRSYFASGATRSYEWRRKQLEALRLGLKENLEGAVAALKEDLGRPALEGVLGDITVTVQEIDFALANLKSWMSPHKVPTPILNQPGSSYTVAQPKGVVLVLAPWNYPIHLSLTCLIAAISAGNCSFLKPSEVSPKSTEYVKFICEKYLDREAFHIVLGAVPECTALLRLRWDHIVYTGNGAVGRIVAQAAAKHLTPVTLELGGKSPVYVDPSCSLKTAARRILNGKFMNNGQTCIAPDYVLVHKDVEKQFLAELKSTLKQFFGSDPSTSDSLGRIVSTRHYDRVDELLHNHGGEVIVGGKGNREAKFIPPTIVLNPDTESLLMKEEIFGPILPVLTVSSPNEAIEFIVSREHPLALYVFAEDQSVYEHVIASTTAGGVCINDTVFHITNPNLPFGGVGASGIGAYHGEQSFRELSHNKSVMYRSTWIDPSVRYPPYKPELMGVMEKITFIGGLTPGQKTAIAAAMGAVAFGIYSKAKL